LISYQWLKELLGADPGVQLVADKLTAAGLEVEGIDHVGAHLAPVKVAKVIGSRAHPTSKNPLTLVSIDIGTGEALEVVCGAPNVPSPGGLVCFAPLGARVFDKKGVPFTLEAKPIAGIVSTGMLCAEDELLLGSDHAGIIVLPSGKPGESLLAWNPALEDWILTLNVTPNRPDALGHIGVARDVAALLGIAFTPSAPPRPARTRESSAEFAVEVRIDDVQRCPRYDAAVLTDVTIAPSPLWLRARLHRLGVRPISNVVDVTNLVMLEQGQPMHAFDLREIGSKQIVVRRANDGEVLQTLDGVSRKLVPEDLVIADASRALALAGVMGGEQSGITNDTKTIVLESAYFEPRGIRRTSKRHAIHSESSHRFERNVDPHGIPRALARATALIAELGGGIAVGAPIDAYPKPLPERRITMRHARVRAVLGIEVPADRSEAILRALDFGVVRSDTESITLDVPLHRPDVEREIDLIEEVGRIHGFDHIHGERPPTSGARAGARRDFALRRRLRETLAGLGLDEAVSFAFISPRELEASGFESVPAARIANPLSVDRSVMRPSLLPRLFTTVSYAHRHGVPKTRLFEVGTAFGVENAAEPGLLHETTRIALVLSGPRDSYLSRPADVDFYDAKGLVDALCIALVRVTPRYHTNQPAPAWAHPRRYAWVELDEHRLGVIGEVHPDVRDRAELPRAVVAVEIEAALFDSLRPVMLARAPGRFPTVRRDVALLLPRTAPAGDVGDALRTAAGAACSHVELFDRYVGKELPEGTHSLAFALWFRSDERTLTDDEVDGWVRAAVTAVESRFGAKQR
jgi:phenylalanyl-tRNA synthetase beta chain